MSLKLRSLACAAGAAVLLGLAPSAFATPAFQGLWCGNGLLHKYSLKLTSGDMLGEVDGLLSRGTRSRELHGNVEGSTLRTEATRYGTLMLTLIGSELRITGADGALTLVKGGSFRRAEGEACGS